MNLLTKQKQMHRLREQIYDYQGRQEEQMGSLGLILHTAIFKTKSQQGPTV